ncbi:MAG: nucleoside-diphosphate kinase [Candidatus Yanofskybacteria bacterium]|nr:nucleoside-diphosphate kinase [Candidatus Yanofskybacteria bacterium]
MSTERTLALVKPHAFKFGPEIMRAYKGEGLTILRFEPIMFDERTAGEFYLEHKGKPFYKGLVTYMASSPCIAILLEGENAVAKVREINGATNPREADPNSIRGRYKDLYDPNNRPANFVHGSDSSEAAAREIQLVFKGRF